MAGSIARPLNDRDWNYLKFFDHVSEFVRMEPIGNDHYECIYLRGHPSLSTSNAADGAYHSRDVFVKHPSLPHRWKYVARLDDQITLVNGEKVHPLSIEGKIRQHALVQEAVVVGIQRAVPGLLIFRSVHAHGLSDEEIVDQVWGVVEDANSRAEQFSQIARGLIKVLPARAICPTTDKGSMIRAQVNRQFAPAIDELYQSAETGTGGLVVGDEATQEHLLQLCREGLGRPVGPGDNLYAQGVDSLQAIDLRRMVLRDFRFPGDRTLPPNIVYEMENVSQLAKRICEIQQGRLATPDHSRAHAASLVQKYWTFRHHTPRTGASDRNAVVCLGRCFFLLPIC